MGLTKNLGVVSPVPMGSWNAQTTYQMLNIVTNNKNTYLAIESNADIEPGVNENWQTYWMQLSPGIGDIQSAFADEFNDAVNNYEEIMDNNFSTLETELNNKFNELEQNSTASQVIENTNNIKALFNLQLNKNVLAYDDAEMTEEIQQTGGTDLAGLSILDDSYATVNKISGNTVKCENLINVDAMVNSALVKNADGSYTLTKNGSNRFSATFNCNIPAGNYMGRANIISSSIVGRLYFSFVVKLADGTSTTAGYDKSTNKVWFITNKDVIGFQLYMEDYEADGCYTTFKDFMLNSYTDEANLYLPYQPYFTGLKNAQISGIKSIGRNLWTPANLLGKCTVADASKKLKISDTSGYTGFYIPVAPNTNYTIAYNKIYEIIFAFSNGIIDGSDIIGKYRQVNSGQSITENSGNAKYLIVTKWTSSMPADFSVMVNIGSTALPEEAYIESVMTLPETVELGKWDYIENGQIVRQTIIETYDSTKYDETANTYNGTNDFILSADSTQVAYKGTATNTPITFNNQYLVWDKGIEQVLTPTDESGNNCFDYGANTTEENNYYVIVGGNE